MSAEEALARELTDRGADGVAAYRLIPKEELRDKTKVKGWFERADVKSLVVMRLVSSKKEGNYSPVFWTTSSYGSIWDYYGYAWDSFYAPGSTTIDRVLTIEILIYSVANGHLLWASMSEKTNPRSPSMHNCGDGFVPSGLRAERAQSATSAENKVWPSLRVEARRSTVT